VSAGNPNLENLETHPPEWGERIAEERRDRMKGNGGGPLPGDQVLATTGSGGCREVQLSGRQLEAVVADAVQALLERNGSDGKGEPRNAHPSRALSGVVLAALLRSQRTFPPLQGFTESPIFAKDGAIFDHAGYNTDTRLFYMPQPGFSLPRVPESATKAEITTAVQIIGELFLDFPFRSDADRTTAWAALVTVVLRPLITGQVPAMLFDAPAPGTGKGLLAKVIAVTASGRSPSMLSPPGDRDDAEWRKRITSTLLGGGSLAVVDNLEHPLGSAALASLLTSDSWTDRLLGRSEMVNLPAGTVWFITGNNIRLRGDLPRRVVWCRMDAKLARPWTRERFRHPDLLGWTHEHRGELLASVFTLARAWIAAGRPGPDTAAPRLGSFEVWRRVVGGILGLAGVSDFLGNLPELYDAADEDTPAWTAFLAAWAREFDKALTAAELAAAVQQGGQLRDALPPELADALETAKSFTRRLGKALSRRRETRFPIEDGRTLRVVKAGMASGRGGVLRWRVVSE